MKQLPYVAATAVLAAILAAVTLYNGPSVIDAPSDVFVLIAGAWRMLLGQAPHVDFDNPVGSLTYALVAAGMKIGGVQSLGFPWAAIILMAIATIWGGYIAFSRLPGWVAFALVAFLAIMCVATRPLGYDPGNHSYAMLYNRIGWLFLVMLTVQAFVPRPAATPRQDVGDAFSVGAILPFLFYTKVTFVGVGAGALLLAILARPSVRSRNNALAVWAGSLSALLLLWFALNSNPFAYVQDLSLTAQAQSAWHRFNQLREEIRHGLLPLGALSVAWLALIGRRIWVERRLSRESIMVTLQFAFCCGAGLLLTVGNTGERGEVPYYVLAGMVLFLNAGLAVEDRFRGATLIAVGAVPLVIAAAIAARDLQSIADTTAWRSYRIADAPAAQRIAAGPLRNFVVPHDSLHQTQFWRSAYVPSRINEALEILQRRITPGSRLMVFAQSDPFSIALELRPAKGGLLFWARNYSYSLDAHPRADEVFGDVTHILIPKLYPEDDGCCMEVPGDLDAIYGDYFRTRFFEIDGSRAWTLLERAVATSAPTSK